MQLPWPPRRLHEFRVLRDRVNLASFAPNVRDLWQIPCRLTPGKETPGQSHLGGPLSPSPRLRGEGRDEGASPQAQTRGQVPSPGMSAKDALIPTSPRKRGEVKALKCDCPDEEPRVKTECYSFAG